MPTDSAQSGGPLAAGPGPASPHRDGDAAAVSRWWSRHWGKARPAADGPAWHPLACHALDVAAVGQAYLSRHPRLTEVLRQSVGLHHADELIAWLCFWLVLHDLGKFSRSFQCLRADLVAELTGHSPSHLGHPDIRHDSLGYWLWQERLLERVEDASWFGALVDWQEGAGAWARAVTGHHGQPPLPQASRLAQHFAPEDIDAAWALVRWAADTFLDDDLRGRIGGLDGHAFELGSRAASWWVAGVAVLADWLGSNTDYFPYRGQEVCDLDAYWHQALDQAGAALAASGVLPVAVRPAQSLASLFPPITQPSPLQHWAAAVALPAAPQIHLLEDVTGAGKTEAAVMLAHRLMAAGVADGLFIGLPTMATANAMYRRIAEVHRRLFDGPASLALAHGRRDLVEEFARSVLAAGPEEHDPDQDGDSATARCSHWLADHNKRALLAPAGVGTIDQALLAALESRHQSLRLLGLFRKVLVVDEVHACDAYMQRTLEGLLTLHARAGGSAILLSATLPQRMKAALLRAYAAGRGSAAPALAARDYPLTTSWPPQAGAGPADEHPVATRAAVCRRVAVRTFTESEALVAEIVAAARRGQCVGWIRNTVGDVLAAQRWLQAHLPDDQITVFHARFTLGDRLDIEDRVLDWLGPGSGPDQRRGRVLIASQVAEQSLDVDLDWLASDLAPIDRLVQRAGRLRRHARAADGARRPQGAPDQRGEPVLWLLAPAWTETPDAGWYRHAFPMAAPVYPDHGRLWLTLQQLRRGSFRMPDDGRDLIEAVYGDEAESPAGLQASSHRATGQAYADRAQAQGRSVNLDGGYARAGTDWLDDGSAPSRLGEPSVDVVLATWDGSRLRPWRCDKVEAWAYSTLRVPRRLIDQAAPPEDPMLAAAIEAALAAMPAGGQWLVLLVQQQQQGRWQAEAITAALPRRAPMRRSWVYDVRVGLVGLETPDVGGPASGEASPQAGGEQT